ncbi:hypothetical protein VaNZ11_000356 [Volvox africanus]|uniref:Protein kinase domain-containing protein n=1 Tax=Volvox africanus TaxID=51714 RepID=A0ABQ5RLZ0_9CHLO|nr:hypothetical protein VaNZ11_000356 [Volvox africanus]
MPGEIARIVPSQEPGVYYVGRDTWQVGARYELRKVLGTGSFSAVCLAYDNLDDVKVALKRVGDVFASPDNAKRVLREVCIMRRLEHPNIIRLMDVFLKPSPTGKYVLRGGRLVPTSYDCYMAMEYCDQGDLFNMRGQLPEHEVRSLMWQLLGALRYLHGLNVWHRDIKTGNLLLTLQEGRRILKVADFGSARSAKEVNDPGKFVQADSGNGRPELPLAGGDGMDLEEDSNGARRYTALAQASHCSGEGNMGNGAAVERCGSTIHRKSRPSGTCGGSVTSGLVAVPAPDGGYQPPLTSLVCTPCYRAPEVVMSRGGYSSAIDMWSAGCVFGELLQRAAYVGKASTPHLQVAPVFAITGKPLTPHSGQRYGSAEPGGSTSASAELSALFAVIGTPAWACIEAVPSDAWRRYLFHIPGRTSLAGRSLLDLLTDVPLELFGPKAPTLHRRFSQAGEVGVDLLARLLQFDPGRRASAEEAMAHEYFAIMHVEAQMAATVLASQVTGYRRVGSRQYHKSGPPWEGDEETRPLVGSLTASGPGLSSLPVWPPARGPSSGPGSGSGDPGPSAVMEVDMQGGEGGSKAGAAAQRGSVPRTGSLITQPPSGGARGCISLLTKRKQLENSSEEELAERRLTQPPGRDQQQAPRQSEGCPGERRGQQQAAASHGVSQHQSDDRRKLSFWQIDEPALALAALEAELVSLVPPDMPGNSLDAALLTDRARAATVSQTAEALALVEECKERLREMLERECAEHTARATVRRGAEQEMREQRSSDGESAGPGSSTGGCGSLRGNSESLLVGSEVQILGGAAGAAALHGHLRPDPGQQLDPSIIGYERIPYHADAAAARLEPEKHLWAGRHGEWTQSSLAAQRREAASGTWGVTLMPPGLDAGTPAGKAYIDVVRSQQAR